MELPIRFFKISKKMPNCFSLRFCEITNLFSSKFLWKCQCFSLKFPWNYVSSKYLWKCQSVFFKISLKMPMFLFKISVKLQICFLKNFRENANPCFFKISWNCQSVFFKISVKWPIRFFKISLKWPIRFFKMANLFFQGNRGFSLNFLTMPIHFLQNFFLKFKIWISCLEITFII